METSRKSLDGLYQILCKQKKGLFIKVQCDDDRWKILQLYRKSGKYFTISPRRSSEISINTDQFHKLLKHRMRLDLDRSDDPVTLMNLIDKEKDLSSEKDRLRPEQKIEQEETVVEKVVETEVAKQETEVAKQLVLRLLEGLIDHFKQPHWYTKLAILLALIGTFLTGFSSCFESAKKQYQDYTTSTPSDETPNPPDKKNK